MTKINITSKILISLISTILFINTYAQDNNGMYFMKMIPQTNYMNPAIHSDCKFYLGAAPLASTYLEFNSAISLNTILYPDTESDSTVTFLASKEYQDKLIKKLDKSKNLFGVENQLTIGSIGFRAKNLYFNLDIIAKSNMDMNIPADLANLITKGNFSPPNTYYSYDLSNFDINATSYIESSIGVSYDYDEQWTFGIRPKMIQGLFNVSTSDRDVQFNSTVGGVNISSDFTLHTSIPGFNVVYDSLGLVDIESSGIDSNLASNEFITGKGFGLDLGGIYKYDDKFTFYASIVDLGWIKWKTNPNNMSFTSSYDFDGIDVSDMVKRNKEDETDTTSFIDEFIDSLKESFTIPNDTLAYKTGLGTKLYLGATYSVLDKIDVGVLSRSQIYRGRFRQQLTFSANFRPLDILHATISYTIKNNTFNNLGYGLSYKFGPFNSYVIIDQSVAFKMMARDEIIVEEGKSPYPIPHNLNKYSIRFGANLMFGCGNKKKKKIDEPIID